MGQINDAAENTGSRLKAIFRASVVAILVNISLGIFKAIVGIISNSIAITLDAINNFTDAGSSFITILSSSFASKDADKKHPFGYGRIEYLGTLLIAVLILYAGITSLIESIKSIINPEAPEYSTVSLVIVIVAVIVKFLLTIYITRVGKKVNSDSLIASGKESIGDVAISIATVVAALLFVSFGISIEAWLGAVIALFIVNAGVETLFETVAKLLGTGADASLVRDIKKAIAENDAVVGAYDLVLHNYGPDDYLGSVHVEVEDTLPISKFDNISRMIQEDIAKRFGVNLTAIGLYSVNTVDESIISMREKVRTIALDTEFVNQLHGFYVDENTKNMRFDIVISLEAGDRRKVYRDVIEKVEKEYPEYTVKAGMDMDYNEI